MGEPRWQAQIRAGKQLGAGFLLDERHVVTCAHVVPGMEQAVVSFPATAGRHAGLSASVVHRGPWAKPHDHGDVAVLRLDGPVDIEPAVLARPDQLRVAGAGELKAYGFRKGNEVTGSIATVTADWTHSLLGEWTQLTSVTGHGERLERGFSGAAVYSPRSGLVVGMVTDADQDPSRRTGLMLSCRALREHWEDLDDWLAPAWATQEDWRELRRLVRELVAPEAAARAYLSAFAGRPLDKEFGSAWDAVRFVVEEHPADGDWRQGEELAALLDSMAAHLPRQHAFERLLAWRRRVLARPPSRHTATGPPSIIIKIEASGGGGNQVTFSTWGAGVRPLFRHHERVPTRRVRALVEQELPAFLGCVEGQEFLVEFVLPETWLDKPVEEWGSDPDDREPLGLLYPVVVRDVKRLRPGPRRAMALTRWSRLRKVGALQPDLVGCRDARDNGALRRWMARDERSVIVHAALHKPLRMMALKYGVPVMVWSRGSCTGHEHGACAEELFLEDVVRIISEIHPDDLPRHVRRLRSGDAAGDRKIALFWDDPQRLADPPLAMAR
ncbi:trypsin-like peptidase domain-containing protein [Nonomuraea sp. NPDC049400]|uniref:VMAP-C domain-containing protein n=1 Tax=Nonomuraea sp. NPDC049400 TaxID=3364352 RepID=UPI0037B64546